MQSLLGQFYNRIKGSQEDIASEGLTYILQNSPESRKVINQIIKNNTDLNFPDLVFQTQDIGENKERPDISGKDEDGNEILIIEAKFWASLTDNQPNQYLKRLKNNSVLIFLVPNLRTRTVFEEVKNRMLNEFQNIEFDVENLKLLIKKSNTHVIVKSWNEILNSIKIRIEQTNNINLLSDLNQIIGLCDVIDKNAFQPITDEDLSPKIPKNINSYYEIVDKVVDELKNRDSNFSTKGLIRTAQRYGYHRYFSTDDLILNFSLKLDLWEKCADTPFWFGITQKVNNKEVQNERLKKLIETIAIKQNLVFINYANNCGTFLAIKPKLYETEDVVIKNLTNTIELIIKEINNYRQQWL